MPNLSVLYIHGYGSDQNSTTANVLRTQLAPHNIDVHSPTIPANAHEAIPFVKNYIAKNDIRIIVASSLGAFIALKQNLDKFIIVCNPCIAPTIELAKLGVNKAICDSYERYEKTLLQDMDSEARRNIIGIFGSNDELFSYKAYFDRKKIITLSTSDKHRISPHTVTNIIVPLILDRAKNINISESVVLNERWVNIWDKEQIMAHKQIIWDLVQTAYEGIDGGYLGADTPDELAGDIDFAKFVRRGEKFMAVFGYSLKRGGRKGIVVGHDGTPQGKVELKKLVAEDVSRDERRSWAEVSGAMEALYRKAKANPIPADVVRMLLPDKDIIKVHEDGFHYDRFIGGQLHTKICYGNIKI